MVHLTPSYLGKLFKMNLNMTFTDFLTNIRLEQAKVLLVTTDEQAYEICKKVGIHNVSYFSTLFKKKFAMTPTQYRNTIR